MSLVAGIDVGSRHCKVVVCDGPVVVGRGAAITGADHDGASRAALRAALEAAGRGQADLAFVVATGFARHRVGLRNAQASELTCLGRAARVLAPGVTRALDLGAQLFRAVHVDPQGRVVASRLSDRCAAGGGRFLERAARMLDLSLADFHQAAVRAPGERPLRAVCAVLGESEIVSRVSQGMDADSIAAAVEGLIAARGAETLLPLGGTGPVLVCGGPSEAPAVRRALGTELGGVEVRFAEAPAHAVALGAARLAHERWLGGRAHLPIADGPVGLPTVDRGPPGPLPCAILRAPCAESSGSSDTRKQPT